jgi:hypothetical protein
VNKIIINSFQKTGNTILEFGLKKVFPNIQVVDEIGTSSAFSQADSNTGIVSILRNPADAISTAAATVAELAVVHSQETPHPLTLDMDIWDKISFNISDFVSYYLRFHNSLKDNADKCLILDYESMINNFSYASDKVKSKFNLNSNVSVTVSSINEDILKDPKSELTNISADYVQLVKNVVTKDANYQACVDIYNTLEASL